MSTERRRIYDIVNVLEAVQMMTKVSDSRGRMKLYTVLGGRLGKRCCNMFSESSTGSWAELQLPCCLSKQWTLPENMKQNLLLNLPPQIVVGIFLEIG